MVKGKIVSIRGIVVDVEFPEGEKLPQIYEALETESKNSDDENVVIEVLQQLE
jgi:F0F1-type ATP synthase beta subunit